MFDDKGYLPRGIGLRRNKYCLSCRKVRSSSITINQRHEDSTLAPDKIVNLRSRLRQLFSYRDDARDAYSTHLSGRISVGAAAGIVYLDKGDPSIVGHVHGL